MYRRCLAPFVLPTIYDDTLSYQELLDKVIYRLNELTEYINTTLDDINDIVAEDVEKSTKDLYTYIDDAITGVSLRIDEAEKNLNEYKKLNDLAVSNLSKKVDDNYNSLVLMLNNKISEVLLLLNNLESKLEIMISEAEQRGLRYTDSKVGVEKIERQNDIRLLNERISNLILEYPEVFDPITGKKEKINRVIMDLYNGLRVCGLTAIAYDNLGLTAEEYDSLGLTALEYDVYGGYIFAEKVNVMFNPFTGEKNNWKECILSIANILKPNAKTAGEYDAFGYTAEEFDSSDFNALTQDTSKQWHSVNKDLLNKRFTNTRLCWTNESAESSQGVVDIPIPSDTLMFIIEYKFDGILYKKQFKFNEESELCLNYVQQTGTETHLYERYLLNNVDANGNYSLISSDCLNTTVNSGESAVDNEQLTIENVFVIYEWTNY